MAVRRPNKVAKPVPYKPPTEAMYRKWQEESLKSGHPPLVNLYGEDRPPKGHRADCHSDQIKTGNCTCRRMAAYKKGGMKAVDKLMKGERGWTEKKA